MKNLRNPTLKPARPRICRYRWTDPDCSFRVFHYPGRGGTQVRYFTMRVDAEAFAVGRVCWGLPAQVDEKRGDMVLVNGALLALPNGGQP